MKVGMWLMCRKSNNPSVQAFALDHINDVVVNTVGLFGAHPISQCCASIIGFNAAMQCFECLLTTHAYTGVIQISSARAQAHDDVSQTHAIRSEMGRSV